MRDSDQAIVRRALLTLLDRLDRLDGPARVEPEILGAANEGQPAIDGRSRSQVSGGDSPIIIIFLGQSGAAHDDIHDSVARPDGTRGEAREGHEQSGRASYERPFTFDPRGIQTVHPGLEKFPLAETESPLPAPKTCFMEPGRVCVNSGACEMRGY